MRRRSMFRTLIGLGFATSLAACAVAGEDDELAGTKKNDGTMPEDVARATTALPEAEVVQLNGDGVPTFIRGELAKVSPVQADDRIGAEAALRPALVQVLAPFRLAPEALRLRKINVDENGDRHFRFAQTHNGLDVIGGDLVVHVDVKGAVYGVNGTARGDVPARLGLNDIGSAEAVERVALDARFAGMSAAAPRAVYLIQPDGAMHKAYETVVEGFRGLDPVRDHVFVDVDTGEILAVHPQIHFAENRRVHNANNLTSLPGTLRRSEGQAPTGDLDIDAAYDNSGSTYEAYKNFFNRDSYNNNGAALISTVHYSRNYCNAFWNGTQMVYGDGNGTNCFPLARSVDVAAHELTHAVTDNESDLIYSGESGGLNEAMSDIFGAFVEAWVDGGKNGALAISADTWLIGEDVLPPALRYMNDPAKDGVSKDFWVSGVGSADVHYTSGIANLAFYLMSQGGTHPRGKSNVVVAGIGMAKAVRVFYKINVDYLTASSNFLAARNASLSAASDLGFSDVEKASVQNAWAAVGVGTAAGGGGGDPVPVPTDDVVLTNGVGMSGLSGTRGTQRYFKLVVPSGATGLSFAIAGGTGDADLYVKFGSRPTLTSYECRPYSGGNNETCNVATAQAGTYYVMLNAYSNYSGVTLTGKFTTAGDGVPVLGSGAQVTGISGASSSAKYWKVVLPSTRTLTVKISGGTGDADLYTRALAKPTTSAYSCRPYSGGNSETCTLVNAAAGEHYIMVRGYSSYSGVTLSVSY
jgi:vibriolysin